jgi:spermidine/putrescine transport system ATP-binding protein
MVDVTGTKAGAVTLTVRPEQVRIEAEGAGGIPAVVKSLVYFGTDTHCHLALSDGEAVVARVQNPTGGDVGLAVGQAVSLRFAAGAAQVLED